MSDEKDLEAAIFAERWKMTSLTLLLESVITSLPPAIQQSIASTYTEACEQTIAAILGGSRKEETLQLFERAMKMQRTRLERLGVPLPPLL